LPTGLSVNTTYYVIRNSSTSISFASTLANAQNSNPITLTGAGSGVHTLTWTGTARNLGELGGEEAHAQSGNELFAHVHATGYGTTGLSGVTAGATGPQSPGTNTASVGGNQAANIMNPFVGLYFLVKT